MDISFTSLETIIKFLGLIVALVGMITTWISIKKKILPIGRLKEKTWIRLLKGSFLIFLVIAIICLAFIIIAINQPEETRITITDPDNDDTVSQITMIRGTAINLPNDKAMWVVVYCPSMGRYFPQNSSFYPNDLGEWEYKTYIGIGNDSGKIFEIKVVLAGSSAQHVFTTYITESETTGSWDGMATLPDGAQSYAHVLVTRR